MSWDILKNEIYEKWKPYWFQVHPPEIAEYSWNYLFTGGKQIRPKLFCELCEYLSPALKIPAELAFAIECIHVASIVLDDTPWMDDANERRGQKTLHTVFSPKKAALISYELIDIVRNIWLNNKPPHVSDEIWQKLLVSKLQRLAIGQAYDIEKKGNLIELASLKTGVLFELVTETVALCVGLDTEFWKFWGNNLGILFQWMDDFHDQEQDIIQSNRNAFNEAYDTTLKNYEYLWSKIEMGIGKQWFEKPFGKFMLNYFTNDIPITRNNNLSSLNDSILITYPTELMIPQITTYDFEKKNVLPQLSGKDIVDRLFRISGDFFTIPSIKINLWHVDENNWEHLEEINNLLSRAQNK
jgi:hypothetical protein